MLINWNMVMLLAAVVAGIGLFFYLGQHEKSSICYEWIDGMKESFVCLN